MQVTSRSAFNLISPGLALWNHSRSGSAAWLYGRPQLGMLGLRRHALNPSEGSIRVTSSKRVPGHWTQIAPRSFQLPPRGAWTKMRLTPSTGAIASEAPPAQLRARGTRGPETASSPQPTIEVKHGENVCTLDNLSCLFIAIIMNIMKYVS